MKFSKLNLAILSSLFLTTGAFAQTASEDPQNFYITYLSQNDVKALVQYGESQNIHQFFMWTVDQDTPINDPKSLINATVAAGKNAQDNHFSFAAYYPNYAAYNDQRAIPGKAYLITPNADLDSKLPQLQKLIYAFAETQVLTGTINDYINTPHSFGAIYLYDPWSDLASSDPFCGKSSSNNDGIPRDSQGYNLICGYAFDSDSTHHQYDDTAAYNHFGNFEAFANLKAKNPNLSVALSIGGFGHNATFEAIFDPASHGVSSVTQEQAIQNFVNSVILVMNHYNLDSIDIDYENVQMTHQNSEDYLTLLTALNTALTPLNKTITLPIITNPAYISGTETNNTIGFAPGVLQKIAALSQVSAIELMTYDFSGTFNYGGDKRTGFLTNTYLPNNYPDKAPDAYTFSVETATQAALNAGVPANKISLGIASYGRALGNLPPSTTDQTYLFSTLDANVIIPRGDQDVGANATQGTPACDQNITNWNHADACQGMFSYNYIVNKILPLNQVIATDHQNNSGNAYNGTTAFGLWSPAVSATHKLTVINQNGASGEVDITNSSNSFSTNGFFPTGTQVYDTTSTPRLSSIESQEDLTASFKYWKQTIQCTGTANFDHDLTVTITSDAIPTCSIT
jgi:GH18 family chitinase